MFNIQFNWSTPMQQTQPLTIISLITVGILSFSSTLYADDSKLHYDQIQLSAYATMEVENDTQIAVLYAQKEGPELSPLTDRVNQLITQAVAQAKQHDGVKVSTLDYRTSPRYQQNQLTGWRVRQSVRLESKESKAMSELLGKLQSGLALESIRYSISPKQRLSAEEALTAQAISAFRKKAEQVTQLMGRSRYRLVEMNLYANDQQPQPYPMRASAMALESRATAPTLEGGSQALRVDINGKIELQLE
jgi:predicted secreted protein